MNIYITGLGSGYEVEHLVRLFYPMAPLTLPPQKAPPRHPEDAGAGLFFSPLPTLGCQTPVLHGQKAGAFFEELGKAAGGGVADHLGDLAHGHANGLQ